MKLDIIYIHVHVPQCPWHACRQVPTNIYFYMMYTFLVVVWQAWQENMLSVSNLRKKVHVLGKHLEMCICMEAATLTP